MLKAVLLVAVKNGNNSNTQQPRKQKTKCSHLHTLEYYSVMDVKC